jgi:hypothetical protein
MLHPTLILTSEYARLGRDARQLSRREAAGELSRIRQGVYVPTAEWRALPAWEKYPLLIQAAASTLRSQTVFCRQSAACAWGVPLLGVHTLVHACTADGGGGRSRAGVRRHRVDTGSLEIEERSGLLVTSRVRTVLDLAAFDCFGQAVVAFDHVLKPDSVRGLQAVTKDQIAGGLAPYTDAAVRRIRAALDFADPAAGSPGESLSRAFMHLGGFKPPSLQSEIRDARGFAGYLDFEWPEDGLAGEFDGMVKYQRAEYLQGRSTSQVVIDEKRREDRIRATGRRVIRWTWSELKDSRKFAAFLDGAGVPRLKRPSCRLPDMRYEIGQPLRRST